MILIFPWSRKTTDGKSSPKNYPYWEAVVEGLVGKGHEVLQVSCTGEVGVAGTRRVDDLPLEKIADLMKTCETWISCDNFAHHMAWTLNEPGIVIFGMSDPAIFGHPENLNILKDAKYLRARQFGLWSQEPENPAAFVGPQAVLEAVRLSIKQRKSRPASGIPTPK
jgi:ADP-heptose:LPS heptosyltransferase